MLNFLSECNIRFKFVVYTAQAGILQPYKENLGDKLTIREYIPRGELLVVLAGMDFLLNFDNNTHTQLPSKLIDYAITGRPVLNISSDTDFSLLIEFFNGNYSRKIDLAPAEDYDIRVVADRFLELQANK